MRVLVKTGFIAACLTHGCCVAAFASLCDHSHINQAALRVLLKPENMSSSAHAKQISALFYRRFQSFQSLFGSPFSLVSIAVWICFNRLQNNGAKLFRIWKTCHQAHNQYKYPYASFVCTLQVLPCIAISNRFSLCLDHCLNLFQSITKHCSTGAKLFCIWNFLSAAFFGIRESPLRALCIFTYVYVQGNACIELAWYPGNH